MCSLHVCNIATGSAGEGVYCEQRRLWGEDRGVSWTPKNRRPEKLRDTLKECEVSNNFVSSIPNFSFLDYNSVKELGDKNKQ